jgi:hypothetical protein
MIRIVSLQISNYYANKHCYPGEEANEIKNVNGYVIGYDRGVTCDRTIGLLPIRFTHIAHPSVVLPLVYRPQLQHLV